MQICVHCGASTLRKNGLTSNGKQRYYCRNCGRNSRPTPGTNAYSEERKAEILRAYHERTSLRGLTRIFGVSRQTVTAWLKKSPEHTAASPDAGASAARG
jgi:transposase-like protein